MGEASYKMNNKSKNSKIIKNEYNKYDSKMKSSKNSNLIPTPMEKEQEKYDSIRKSQIIERHSVEMASYYDYTPDETEGYLNELLEDMNFYGEQAKKEIENQKKINPNKYMSIEEALEQCSPIRRCLFGRIDFAPFRQLAVNLIVESCQGCVKNICILYHIKCLTDLFCR